MIVFPVQSRVVIMAAPAGAAGTSATGVVAAWRRWMMPASRVGEKARVETGSLRTRRSTPTAVYHTSCYQAWHFSRYGTPPRLRRRLLQRHVYADRCAVAEHAT
jgi:hypothetical protein